METIDDIVREMRRRADLGLQIIGVDLRQFADRIEAAAKVERDVSRAWCNKCEAGYIKTENARLRAALKTVVNCELNPIVSCALGLPNCELWLAIQECKRIINESEAK